MAKTAAQWDATYRETPAPFGQAPSAGLVAGLAAHGPQRPGRALLPADGDGRNGRWLAQAGWTVTALDWSETATAAARAEDARRGATPERLVADLEDWTPEAVPPQDLVAILFLQVPSGLRSRVLGLGAAALAPGGLLIVEGFAGAADDARPGGPGATAVRWQTEETVALIEAAGCTVLDALEGLSTLDDGPRHQGRARVLRLVARR
ncbi:MAG: class I SAM-dependent methyltransferase [Pseudomonadota bacterium]